MGRYKLPFDAGRLDQMWIFEAIWQKALAVVEAARTAPEVFFPIFVVGLILIWLKWRVLGKGMRRAARDNYAGWTTDAKAGTKTHETGVGTTSVLVMKPAKMLWVSVWTFVFFGGGALFLATRNAPLTLRDKASVAISAVFALLAVVLFIRSFDRIRIYDGRIERTRLFARRVSAPLSTLTSVAPLSKTILGGVTLTFNDGQRLKIPARMTGYRQLLDHLAVEDPKLRLMMTLATRQMEAQK
ncbi:hypothetical protein [uncultured Sulfitobacter sp.]|uniref:hypothetical protein n=1 Tax=uncultured Sulfitobacter sp. TaxID=191468 RepID=UPI0026026349|nr:hypothetical protein [uncultured Sulfitobacter sp.]